MTSKSRGNFIMSAKLKQQVTDLLLNNSDILKLIAEAVSSLIVENFTNNEETVGQIAEKISNKPDFIKAIKLNTSDQESLKQELHESLSFDYKNLQDKQQELEKICREMRETNQDLVWVWTVWNSMGAEIVSFFMVFQSSHMEAEAKILALPSLR